MNKINISAKNPKMGFLSKETEPTTPVEDAAPRGEDGADNAKWDALTADLTLDELQELCNYCEMKLDEQMEDQDVMPEPPEKEDTVDNDPENY